MAIPQILNWTKTNPAAPGAGYASNVRIILSFDQDADAASCVSHVAVTPLGAMGLVNTGVTPYSLVDYGMAGFDDFLCSAAFRSCTAPVMIVSPTLDINNIATYCVDNKIEACICQCSMTTFTPSVISPEQLYNLTDINKCLTLMVDVGTYNSGATSTSFASFDQYLTVWAMVAASTRAVGIDMARSQAWQRAAFIDYAAAIAGSNLTNKFMAQHSDGTLINVVPWISNASNVLPAVSHGNQAGPVVYVNRIVTTPGASAF